MSIYHLNYQLLGFTNCFGLIDKMLNLKSLKRLLVVYLKSIETNMFQYNLIKIVIEVVI